MGCHICSTSFRKNAIKEKCPCGSYYHKNCLGNCKISLKFFFETLYIKKDHECKWRIQHERSTLNPFPQPPILIQFAFNCQTLRWSLDWPHSSFLQKIALFSYVISFFASRSKCHFTFFPFSNIFLCILMKIWLIFIQDWWGYNKIYRKYFPTSVFSVYWR